MTYDDLRTMALGWPGVVDGTSYGTPALKARGQLLVRLKEDGDSLVMPGIDADERDMLIDVAPQAFYVTDHYRAHPIVLIRLSAAHPEQVKPLLWRRWSTLASKRMIKDLALSPEARP